LELTGGGVDNRESRRRNRITGKTCQRHFYRSYRL